MNRTDAAKIVAVILTACPAQASKLDREKQVGMVDTFAMLLDDIPYEHANAALRVLLQTRTWMPSVADIRATVLELQHGPQRNGGDAWGTVLHCISRYGSYRNPGTDFVFCDPVVARCVAALGWQNLCLSENQVADRARFIELYDKLASQAQREAQAPLLLDAGKRDTANAGAQIVDIVAKRLTDGGSK